jgi:hypothetical protein
MRWLRGAVAVAALGVFVAATANAKVPSFVRMTGLACNQCHVSWSPTPDLTFTGLKFRLNGYRTPFVADKIEAGEEGSMNGNRLVLGLQNAWTLHYRSYLLQQSKSPSDPSLPAPSAGAISSQPLGTVGLDYAGAIGEHFGIWTEYYFSSKNATDNVNTINFVEDPEYEVRYVFNPGGNIVGMMFTTQDIGAGLFGAWYPGAPSSFSGEGGNGARSPYTDLGFYGLLNDRVTLGAFIEPGEDNLDYKRLNYTGYLGFLPFNSDGNYMWVTMQVKAGNDQIPGVSHITTQLGTNNIVTVNAIRGVSALHSGGSAYTSANTGDGTHFIFDAHGGFTDRGPYSAAYSISAATDNETYNDGSMYKSVGAGFRARFFYNRTYGVNFDISKHLSRSFTDATGVKHDIPDDPTATLGFVYRPAMNFAWEFSFTANSQSSVLDQNWRNGWSWNLMWHFLY